MNAVTDIESERHARLLARLKHLHAHDAQWRDSIPLDAVIAAKSQPGLHLAQVVEIVMKGYADRPALGQRARELVTGVDGRRTLELLPRFETLTYRELWARSCAIASELHAHEAHPLRAGDFLCILGFTSVDYANLLLAGVHLGVVNVPLQTSAPASQHAAIMAETTPRLLATSIEHFDTSIDAILLGSVPQRLIVFDYDERDDNQRAVFEAGCARLSNAKCATRVDTLADVVKRGQSAPPAPLFVPKQGEDPLAWLFYTSGSTGTPKGAMMTNQMIIKVWVSTFQRESAGGAPRVPSITLSFMPMSHLIGNNYLFMSLANGGSSYCAPKSDLSTLFEDMSLVRPTTSSMVPRVCELFYHHYLSEVDKRVAAGGDREAVEEVVKRELREKVLGGRLISVGCGSASLAPEIYAFMESMLDVHVAIGYSSTEFASGTILVDWKVQRPPVIGYKLDDVPELGYFNTDKPHPRGELLVKSDRFMAGYYKQPELTAAKLDPDGYYRTGDIMAETAPDRLVYLDRRNAVLKLSQGEFVAVTRLEALYTHSPVIRQIYIYGNSERAFLLAVVVPTDELKGELESGGKSTEEVKAIIRRSIQRIADEHALNSYEIPREFLLETVAFTPQNGLLTGVGKHQRPKLKEHYGPRLEQLYAKLAQGQLEELRELRANGSTRPVLETLRRALQSTLGISAVDLEPGAYFSDLGGDSLSALTFSTLLEEIFGVEVPVGRIVGPTGTLQQLAAYVEGARSAGAQRATFAKVHPSGGNQIRASELKLAKFIDDEVLRSAPSLPSRDSLQSVLVTGATGFLGRFLALTWLERVAKTGGKVICIARGSDARDANRRIEAALDTDPQLLGRFRKLAADHLEVLPGDLGLSGLGLGDADFKRLANEVDLIVHPAAHVNHILPYNQLFAANVAGTAELIRLAMTSRLKRFHYVSTLGITKFSDRVIDEASDVRSSIPVCDLDEGYAVGYGISKWAGEVLLREAHDLCGLPVSVFRPGMILAHTEYAGQLNVPDMFTRLLFSLAVTGMAPATFYARDLSNGRPRTNYDGLSVDFIAGATAAVGTNDVRGFHTYNMSCPYEDGISLDSFVDWLMEAGCDMKRIAPYEDWLARFETAMHALPQEQQQESMLAILGPYRQPMKPGTRPIFPTEHFRSATAAARMEIPHLTETLIKKYVADLKGLRLL